MKTLQAELSAAKVGSMGYMVSWAKGAPTSAAAAAFVAATTARKNSLVADSPPQVSLLTLPHSSSSSSSASSSSSPLSLSFYLTPQILSLMTTTRGRPEFGCACWGLIGALTVRCGGYKTERLGA